MGYSVKYQSLECKTAQFSSWDCLIIDSHDRPVIVRVLVVEDYIPFRRFISATLCKKRNWQIICEVGDGLEAVKKAEELKPDLILLDIGLPTLNGIAAARLIRKLAPKSKIIFVTTES